MSEVLSSPLHLFNQDVRTLSYVKHVSTDSCINGDLLPIVEITVVIETKEPVQTSHYLQVLALFIKHFGDQAVPVTETGPTTVVISKGRFHPKSAPIKASYHVRSY